MNNKTYLALSLLVSLPLVASEQEKQVSSSASSVTEKQEIDLKERGAQQATLQRVGSCEKLALAAVKAFVPGNTTACETELNAWLEKSSKRKARLDALNAQHKSLDIAWKAALERTSALRAANEDSSDALAAQLSLETRMAENRVTYYLIELDYAKSNELINPLIKSIEE